MTASRRAIARIHAVAAEYDISHLLGCAPRLVIPPTLVVTDTRLALPGTLVNDRVLRREFVPALANAYAMSNSAGSVPAQHVFASSYRLKMCWIHAIAIPAQMVKIQTVRDWSEVAFVVGTVRQLVSPLVPKPTVAVVSCRPLPRPARGRMSSILNNVVDGGQTTLVARNVAHGVPPDVATVGAGPCGDRRSFPTTTHAKTGRIRPLGSILSAHSDRLLDRLIGVSCTRWFQPRGCFSLPQLYKKSLIPWAFRQEGCLS